LRSREVFCSNSWIFLCMNLRDIDSCFTFTSSCPQYGQRRHPSGYVFLQAEQRMLFGSGMKNRRALYTSAVDENRRKTLETLIALAETSNPASCWDDSRAESLLRSQSNPQEMRELGMSKEMIERVFGTAGGFSVRVEARFEAAHYLREYRGVSEPLHGHSYKVEAELAANSGGVDSDAIAVDFISAKQKLEALAKKLDYGCINDVPPFDGLNPSAENIAQWFYRELADAVANENAIVKAITIWEGPANSVTFRPK